MQTDKDERDSENNTSNEDVRLGFGFMFDSEQCKFSISGTEEEVKKHMRQLLYSDLIKKNYAFEQIDSSLFFNDNNVQYDLKIPTRHRSDLINVFSYFKQECRVLCSNYNNTQGPVHDDEGGYSSSLWAYLQFIIIDKIKKIEVKDIKTPPHLEFWPKEELNKLHTLQQAEEQKRLQVKKEIKQQQEADDKHFNQRWFSLFLSYKEAPQTPKKIMLENQELVKAIMPHMRSPFATGEVEALAKIAYKMLSDLSTSKAPIEKELDKILVGTIILAMSIEDQKYGGKRYPLKYAEVNQAAGKIIGRMAFFGDSVDVREFITRVGEEALYCHTLPFETQYLDKYMPKVAALLSADRFEIYHLHEKPLEQISSKLQ